MKVNEWMLPDPPIVKPDTPVTEVARLMVTSGRHEVAVVGASGTLVGLITAADLLAKHARVHMPTYFSLLGYSFPLESRRDEREIEQALAVTASDLMSTDVITCAPEIDVEEAATMMLDRDVSCLPVVEDGRVVGVIDEADIVKLLVVEDDQDAESA